MFAFAQELQSLNQNYKELQRGGPGVTAVPARKGGWWVAVTAARVRTSYHKKLLVLQSSGIPAIRRRSRPGGGHNWHRGVIGRAEYNRKTAAYYRTVSRLKKRGLLTSRGMGLWITDEGMRVAEGLSVSTPRYGHPSPAVLALSGRSYVVSSSGRSRLVSINLPSQK
jgi:hypothetical protein